MGGRWGVAISYGTNHSKSVSMKRTLQICIGSLFFTDTRRPRHRPRKLFFLKLLNNAVCVREERASWRLGERYRTVLVALSRFVHNSR